MTLSVICSLALVSAYLTVFAAAQDQRLALLQQVLIDGMECSNHVYGMCVNVKLVLNVQLAQPAKELDTVRVAAWSHPVLLLMGAVTVMFYVINLMTVVEIF